MSEPEIKNREFELHLRKLDAEIAKLVAEAGKIQSEARWYPFVVLATVLGAAMALVKLLSV